MLIHMERFSLLPKKRNKMINNYCQMIMQEMGLDYSPEMIEILLLANKLSEDDIRIIIGELLSIFDPKLRVTIHKY